MTELPPLGVSGHVDTFCRDNLPPASLWPEFLTELPELHYPDRLNCATELLDATIARYGPDRRCLLTPAGESWSYGQLRGTVDRIARVLVAELGVVPGNRVLLRGPNNPWLAACWLAVVKAGAVAVTTMPLLRSGELTKIAQISRPGLALCDARFLPDLAAADLGGAPIIPYGGTGADDLTARVQRAADGFAAADSSAAADTAAAGTAAADTAAAGTAAAGTAAAGTAAADTAADDVAMLAFTSGTTGRPKATMHFHRDVLAICDTFSERVIQPRPDDIFTGSPPLAFTFGLGGLLLFPLRAGAAALLLERAGPSELADAIDAGNATICSTAPTAYRAMLRSGRTASLGRLRRAVSAGEHLAESTWRAIYEATGLRVIDGIGSTEMLHVFISAADDAIKPGATGKAVPGYRAAVLDDQGAPVPPGTPGRLAVKGPTGCRYLADDRQASYVQNGWNITGDTFAQDEDGYFHYLARTDDMIVSSGYNIAGPEVEEALLGHDAVAECCVVGAPDPDRGELVTAFVVASETAVTGGALAAELQDFVKQKIAPYKYPRAIEFVPSLPRSATGKVQHFVLRERAAKTAAERAAEHAEERQG